MVNPSRKSYRIMGEYWVLCTLEVPKLRMVGSYVNMIMANIKNLSYVPSPTTVTWMERPGFYRD